MFETRWAMSYLRGPLTRNQIQELVQADPNYNPETVAAATAAATSRPAAEPVKKLEPSIDQRQLIPNSVEQCFVEPNERVSGEDRLVYRPALLGRGRLHFVRATYKVDQWMEKSFLASVSGGEMPNEVWDEAEELASKLDLINDPFEGAEFAKPPSDLQKSKNYTTWKKELKEYLYRGQEMTVWKCAELKKYSGPNETLGDFKVQIEQLASEKRDDAVEKLRKKYAKKFSTLRGQIRRGEDKVEVEEEQYKQSRMSSYLNIGSTLMGAILGRRSTRSASTSMRSYGRSGKEKSDIGRAKDSLDELQIKFEDLEREFNDGVAELEDKLSVDNLEYTDLKLAPRKSDISVEQFGICWLPWRVDSSGIAEPIY